MSQPSYAGGHAGITHVDRGALDFFYKKGCRTMLDVGCGPGGHVQAAVDLGYKAIGLDVDITLLLKPHLLGCDLVKTNIIMPMRFDLVWCVEVAEHIPEASVDNLIRTCTDNCSRYLVFTASQNPNPKWHVTIKPAGWWANKIYNHGFEPAPAIRDQVLEASTMSREFLRDTGMVFQRPQVTP